MEMQKIDKQFLAQARVAHASPEFKPHPGQINMNKISKLTILV